MPTGAGRLFGSMERAEVSILVLLDDAYRSGNTWDNLSSIVFQSLFFWMMPTGKLLLKQLFMVLVFQSLFFWMMPTGQRLNTFDCICIMFQSLFFWMMPTGAIRIAQARNIKEVSILVLLDDAYRRKVLESCCENIRVSILVLLDDAYRSLPDQDRTYQYIVSILVLLDDAYRRNLAHFH